ncbi:ABC transporter substrate-binding protein [Amorphus sp. MBR-141]
MLPVFRRLTVLAALVPVIGLGALPAHAETALKVGAAANSAGSLPIVVADQQGLFKEEGLTYERIDFKGGAPAVQALAAGSIDICICAADHAARLEQRGLGGAVLVALASQHSYALMANGDSPAKGFADLTGQKLGITSAGSLTDNTIRYAIKEAGFDADKDFELIAIGRGGAMRAALETGAIAAGMFTTPDIQVNLAEDGKYKLVEDFRVMKYPAQDLVVTDSWLEKNPETAEKVTRAVVKALAMIQKDPAVLNQAIKEMFPKFDDALVAQVAKDVAAGYLSPDGVMSEESYQVLNEMLAASDPSYKAVPYEDVIVTTYFAK